MRKLITLALALMSLCTFTPRSADAETYHSQFLGVCQTGGHNIYAHYRPVECSNGCVEWRWVTDQHNHCRPAYRETMFSVHTYSIQQTRSVRITVAFRTGLAAISGIAGDQPRFRKTVRMAAAPMAIPTLRDRNGETPLIF